MTTNPILAAFAAPLQNILASIISAGNAIVASPTVETAIAQGEGLVFSAINPTQLEGLSIGSLAQEVTNLATALQAHLTSAVAAPTAAAPTATSTAA